MDEVKINKDGLKGIASKVSDQLKADNMYRSSAWFIFIIMFIVAFFISLGNSEFDFAKILQAQFWIDFSITFFGSMLLKWAFGKWGDFEGHKNPLVIAVINEINNAYVTINQRGLLETLTQYIKDFNLNKKLQALKTTVFIRLRQWFRFKNKYRQLKKCILLEEEYRLAETSEERKKEIKNELNDYNFDLETYPQKYTELKESAIETGFATRGNEDEKMTYSEMYELFGKNILITLLSFLLTVGLAVTSVVIEDISWKTMFIFFTRIGLFSMNAYIGFVVGKSGVEKIKYSVLKTIKRFLNTFIEVNDTKVTEVK